MRAFRRQLRSWHCPPDLQLCGRVKQLWSECYSQKQILSILLSEGFEITDRDVTLLRQNLSLRMREPNTERRARAIQGVCLQTTPEDLERFKKRCEESDERLIMGTRRVRTRTWNGIPADDPDLQPRFPSEKTISACKKDLGLTKDRKKYIFVRDTFQRLCTQAGIIKKSHDPEAWEKVKIALVNAVPFLNQAYTQPSMPKKGDPMWFSLDIICSDVAKKIRVLNTRLDIKQVKQTLQLDPHKVTKFRRSFVEILRDANFKSRFDVPIDVWDLLKRTLHSISPHLQAILPIEIWDHKDDKRVRAFEYLCRDVTKRYKDRRGNTRNAVEKNEDIKPEPESPANDFQEPHVVEPNSVIPIAPELLTPRSCNGELANHRPVLRYTADGLATVILKTESSENGNKRNSEDSDEHHEISCAPGNSRNESNTYSHEVDQNRDDFFSRCRTPSTLSIVGNNHVNMQGINDHDHIMHRFGPPATSIAQDDELNVLVMNDHDDIMRRFGSRSPIAIDENDHFERQILEDHADFARQFGYGTPPDFSFMKADHTSAIEDFDDFSSRKGLKTQSILPIAEIDFPTVFIVDKHSDHLLQVTGDHDKHFCMNRAFTEPELPKVKADPPNIPINVDHRGFFSQVRAQPELPIMENEDSKIQIMPSIEVGNPFETSNGDVFVHDHPFYMGPTDYFVSDYDFDEGSISDDEESCQHYEYPDPANFGL